MDVERRARPRGRAFDVRIARMLGVGNENAENQSALPTTGQPLSPRSSPLSASLLPEEKRRRRAKKPGGAEMSRAVTLVRWKDEMPWT
jgi:hypothetical protein